MLRLVADFIGHISLSRKPPCPDRQVGEVAPAPRLDVRIIPKVMMFDLYAPNLAFRLR